MLAAMAAKKTAKVKAKKQRVRRRYHRTRRRWGPGFDDYRTWSHDFDNAMHGLVKNPAVVKMSPEDVVKFATEIADATRVVQSARRPKNYPGW